MAWVGNDAGACRKGSWSPSGPDRTFELLGCEIHTGSAERAQRTGKAEGPGELRATGQLRQKDHSWAD